MSGCANHPRTHGEHSRCPRTGAEILADTRGPGALAAALYRLPATGWQLALAAPQAVILARGGLVTDVQGARYRCADLDGHVEERCR